MTDSTSKYDPDVADEQRFELAVWPETQMRPWHAEVCASGQTSPLRFERPVDLLLYLTELPGSTPPQPRGLR